MKKYIRKEPEKFTIIKWTGDNFEEIKTACTDGVVRKEGDWLSIVTDAAAGNVRLGEYVVMGGEYSDIYSCDDLTDFIEVQD